MSDNAVKLKLQGNEFFKAGKFREACEAYEKAEQADPKNYVYPSHLSVALYELECVGCEAGAHFLRSKWIGLGACGTTCKPFLSFISSTMSKDALTLKQRGDDLFKACQFTEAAMCYQEAEKVDPSNPILSSNLSAALYEAGDYSGCVQAILRSWTLLKSNGEAKPDLIAKLSSRLTKALCQGVCAGTITQDVVLLHHAEICNLQDTAMKMLKTGRARETDANRTRIWDDWVRIHSELNSYAERRESCLHEFSRLPMLCKSLAPEELYFSIGHDQIIDLTSGWLNVLHPLKIECLSREELSQLAFMFGGVGDGRHVLGTLAGLHVAYKQLSKSKRRNFHAHLTLLDSDHSILARDLCMLMLLHELSASTDEDTRMELKATLMYTFLGAVMPSYCYTRLQSTISDLRRRLGASPPDLPTWLHVASESIPAIVGTLERWSSLNKSTRMTLENHEYFSMMDPPNVSSMDEARQRSYRIFVAQKREGIKQYLYTESGMEELVKFGLIPSTVPPARRRKLLDENIEFILDKHQEMFPFGYIRPLEEQWYKAFKVLPPHDELLIRHGVAFTLAWSAVFAKKEINSSLRHQVAMHIEKEWKPNVTLFAPKHSDSTRYAGYPTNSEDVLESVAFIDHFNRRAGPAAHLPPRHSEWIIAAEACDDFYEEVATSLKGLANRITIEVLCGGLSEELFKMHVKADVSRPKAFPRKYTRMWLSNVPDYVHGPMNTIIYNVPNLQDGPEAALAFDSMANRGVFLTDDEYFHTYTLLSAKEIPKYLGCEVVNPRVITELVVLRPMSLPRPLSLLASQDELKTWMTRVLFNTLLPGPSKARPSKINAPHNLVAFFGLLLHLHKVGYPGHWLSDFLSSVLSGSMLSDIAPYLGESPIPLTERTRRVPPRRVRTDPWFVELETIIATAYYALPFSLAGALPEGFCRDPADIAVWEARVKPAQYFSVETWNNPLSPYDFCTHLAFYRSDLVSASEVVKHVKRIFEGATSPVPGSFFILTAQEHVHYQKSVRFRLSRSRVEKMRKNRWTMVAFRNDTGHQATLPVAIQNWDLVSSTS